ncbi:MAG: hypothetical protein NTY60_00090 [Proteobacteria bacterium]|nr:hypothetical protein [Pseudomonadota bacterium]
MKRILFFVLLVFFTLEVPMVFGGEPSTYQIQGLRISQNSDQILIKHGLCIDENDCVEKQLMFFKSASSGLMLSVYGISDVGAISEIIGICLDEYGRNAKRISIEVKVYREKHEETRGLIKSRLISPYIKFYLQGEE